MSTRIIVDEDEPEYDLDEPAFEPRDVILRKDKWVLEEFDIHGFLGRGKFGEVKRCTEKSSGKEFAAKFICAPRAQDKKDVEHELSIMKKLYHKRLIQLYDAFETKTETCLVLEIIYGGELFDRVISDDFILTEKACMAFVRQICEGLEYMHASLIIHLDMKPENILCLTRTGNRIKIIDFGLAREYHPKKDLRVLFGTPEFMAPEVVQYETITFGTDMWSVGVICYVLLSGLSPFMGDTDADTLGNVVKSQYDFNYAEFDDVSDDAKDLIAKLLVKEKNKRLTASECIRHPWLARPPRIHNCSPNLKLTKKRLKRFVYRRKWQKTVNAIIALRRMGFPLASIQRQALGEIASTVDIFGRDITNPDKTNLNVDDIQRSLEVKTYDLNKRKASDSGYESVAVDVAKDLVADSDGVEPDTPTSETCVSSMLISLDTKTTTPTVEEPEVCASPPADTQVSEATFTLALSLPKPKPDQQTSLSLPASRDSSKTTSRASSKEPSPSASGRVTPKADASATKKPSIIDRFGGLFINHKEKDPLPPKKSTKKSTKKSKDKDKDKEKTMSGIVKKDSFKRKIGSKPKQEVYVTTPVVRQKNPHLHMDGVTGSGDIMSNNVSIASVTVNNQRQIAIENNDRCITTTKAKDNSGGASSAASGGAGGEASGRDSGACSGGTSGGVSSGNNGVAKSTNKSKTNTKSGSQSTANNTTGGRAKKSTNGTKNATKNGGRNGAKTKARSPVDGSSVDGPHMGGSSVDPEDDPPPRPSLMSGNVMNKRKMFESTHGRAS